MASRPTHVLSVKEREGKGTCRVGVGWLNPDGSVSIQLNPCVVLSARDDVFISLFPVNEEEGDHG